jgi:NAD+ synthase (glutamine-hydrolysing)
MKTIRLAAAALNQTPLAWESNLENCISAIAGARDRGAQVVCLPELALSGYGCEDAFFAPGVYDTSLEMLAALREHSKGMIVAVGLPLRLRSSNYNVVAVMADGEVLGFNAKRFLAGDGIHYEPRWFSPWRVGRQDEVIWEGKSYPLGDFFYDFGDFRVGMEICRDAWIAQRPGASLFEEEVDVILNPSASHFAFGKHEIRRRFVLEGSRAFGAAYVYSNLLGNEAGRVIYDGDTLVASAGKLVAVGPRFSYQDVSMAVSDVDLDENRILRRGLHSGQSQESQSNDDENKSGFKPINANFRLKALNSPTGAGARTVAENENWENSEDLKSQEFCRAVSLGLFDYLRKSRSQGFVISLSGGADSSATACLVYAMAVLAIEELGLDKFKQKLSHVEKLKVANDLATAMESLLTCVYESTKNSSETTHTAARQLAGALTANFLEFQIEEIVAAYRSLCELGIGRELSWESDDVSLQNIQARTRAPLVWLIANVQSSLLLATSNRSEAAVGYTTMDGDTCGGLSPIGGIDKAFLLHWLRVVQDGALYGVPEIEALSLVTNQRPTAELRPLEFKQTDEDDLMPYPVLDAIERLAIRDHLMPKEVYLRLVPSFEQYDSEQLKSWVERFFVLWSRNQWKRERYAPCFHLDDQNLDPKTWCRFPILSGAFKRELAELHQL